MNVLTYGGGTNSTALAIELMNRDISLDLIIFSDTGGEKPGTYKYIAYFSKHLVSRGYPAITIVKKGGIMETLEEECARKNCLPSIAYGFKTCSHKYKIEPVDKHLNNHIKAREVWKSGEKITKFIGFDADEAHRVKDFTDKKYVVKYPLVEWDMGRKECVESIKREHLMLPGKSACFFCPSSCISEIKALKVQHPDLYDRAVAMEDNAELTSIAGLGRSFSWKNAAGTDDMFEDNYIDIDCGCYDG